MKRVTMGNYKPKAAKKSKTHHASKGHHSKGVALTFWSNDGSLQTEYEQV